MKKVLVRNIEKIVKIIFALSIIGFSIFNLIYAFANDFWCRYMKFFETGARCCFWIFWGCAITLIIFKVYDKKRNI